MSLLPSHHDEFRTKDYWDRFFLERGGEQFEWYGTYKDMENVVDEMIGKNYLRPAMKWHVGDMTAMPEYSNAAYDVVFDKGALDALMSEDTADVAAKAETMFLEISRILSEGGRYVCITLAESYILKSLLSYFTALNYTVSVESVQGGKPSPFKPFYITITKHTHRSGATGDVTLLVDCLGNDAQGRRVTLATAMEQIPRIQEYNQKRFEMGEVRVGRFEILDFVAPYSGGEGDRVRGDVPRFTVTVLDAAHSATRSCVVFFVPSGRESEFQFSTQAGLQGIASEAQCRRLLAVRCNRPHLFPAMQELQAELSPIAMSLKPRGMTAEEMIPYMALEADGNWETLDYGKAAVSGEYIVEEEPDEERPGGVTRRLVFLQNQNFIQTEVKMIEKRDSQKSKSSGGKSKKGKDKKSKDREKEKDKDKVSEGDDAMELDYTYLDDHHKAVLAALVLSPDIVLGGGRPTNTSASTSKPSASAPSSSNSQGQGQGQGVRVPTGLIIGLGGGAMPMCMQRYLPGMRLSTCEMDPDMHAIAVKFFAFSCNPRCCVIISEGMALIERIVDRIALQRQRDRDRDRDRPLSTSPSSTDDKGTPTGAVAGEGAVTGTVVAGAEGAVAEPSEALDFLFIDADSKDSSLGLSAPPATFLTAQALKSLYQVMRPGGLLALNVVARTSSLLEKLVLDLKRTFLEGEEEEEKEREAELEGRDKGKELGVSARTRSSVFLIKASEETANTTLLVVKGGAPLVGVTTAPNSNPNPKSTSTGGKKKALTPAPPGSGTGTGQDAASLRTAREEAVEEWLKATGHSADPLGLVSIIGKLRHA